MSTAVIVDAVRTPLGRRNGKLKDWHPVDLAAETLKALQQRTGISANRLHVVTSHHRVRHIPVVGMMREQRQRGTHTVAGHHGLGSDITASRQLSQLLQQSVQKVGIGA